MFSEVAERLDKRGRKLLFALTTLAAVGGSQLSTILTADLAGHTGRLFFFYEAAIGLTASTVIVSLARVAFSKPLRNARESFSRNERRFRILAEDSADLILTLGRTSILALGGRPIASVLGYSSQEARAMPLAEFVHPDHRITIRRQHSQLGPTNPRVTATVQLQHKAGHTIWADVCLHRISQDNGEVETIGTIRDVSLRHREEEALRHATLVAQRAQAEADRANEAKTEFLACTSHEIRTPLNSVIGFAGLLLQRTDLDGQARLYAERIRAAGKALLTLVDDILDFSRIEAGGLVLAPAPFAISSIVDECLAIVKQDALDKSLSLHVHLVDRLPAAVLGDAARFRQVLLNLLSNAIKFTQQGSVIIDIRLDRSMEARDKIKFSVSDTGPGVADDDLPRLFKRFAQANKQVARVNGGAGLGLAISKRLVELMGGTIGVESETGVGSTFWFTLPLPAHDAIVARTRSEPSIAIEPCKILIVDDEPMNQDLVKLILESGGHSVEVLGNGTEAIMAVQDADYDLVLMDVQMPFLDGLTTTRMIRQLPHPCKNLPIIAMTANALPEQARTAREAGMTDVILKPFTPEQVHAVISRVMGVFVNSSAAPLDGDVLVRLANLIGDSKTKTLLASLASSLKTRFDADPNTPDGRAALKRQAHACIAGSGMLGFAGFAERCKAFEAWDDESGFAERLDALKTDLRAVIAEAMRLSQSEGDLIAISAAA